MCIKSRVQKAKKQAEKTMLMTRHSEFKSSYGCRSLSNEAINYQTTLEFETDLLKPADNNNGWQSERSLKSFEIEDVSFPQINCTCQKVTGHGMEDCKGNSFTVCYHSMAAIVKKAELKNATVTFFNNFSPALNYSNFGGKLVRVKSVQADKTCWIVINSQQSKVLDWSSIDKKDIENKINLMRGPVEEGID